MATSLLRFFNLGPGDSARIRILEDADYSALEARALAHQLSASMGAAAYAMRDFGMSIAQLSEQTRAAISGDEEEEDDVMDHMQTFPDIVTRMGVPPPLTLRSFDFSEPREDTHTVRYTMVRNLIPEEVFRVVDRQIGLVNISSALLDSRVNLTHGLMSDLFTNPIRRVAILLRQNPPASTTSYADNFMLQCYLLRYFCTGITLPMDRPLLAREMLPAYDREMRGTAATSVFRDYMDLDPFEYMLSSVVDESSSLWCLRQSPEYFAYWATYHGRTTGGLMQGETPALVDSRARHAAMVSSRSVSLPRMRAALEADVRSRWVMPEEDSVWVREPRQTAPEPKRFTAKVISRPRVAFRTVFGRSIQIVKDEDGTVALVPKAEGTE